MDQDAENYLGLYHMYKMLRLVDTTIDKSERDTLTISMDIAFKGLAMQKQISQAFFDEFYKQPEAVEKLEGEAKRLVQYIIGEIEQFPPIPGVAALSMAITRLGVKNIASQAVIASQLQKNACNTM